jgi:queuine tRNA-ribosyltransferase
MAEFFNLEKTDELSKARTGLITTGHGIIETPVFMPVGTQSAVKAISHNNLKEIDFKIILGNTYHLYLRPGVGAFKVFGGLHRFMNWDRAILTDSGGYQVFSLKEMRKLTEEGVEFRSILDGSKHLFTPENVIEFQRWLGSDIIMPLDECTTYPVDIVEAKKSMELTIRWAKRSKEAFEKSQSVYGHRQFLFSISQGSMYQELRRTCSEQLNEIGFDGYAIGGLSVGEPAEIMYEITDICTDSIPKDKPRYLMGVGTPENILEAIERGIDMFDCVLPTRNARNGQLFTTNGKINIKNAKFKYSKSAIDENIDCYASRNYSLGYLRHLFLSGEIFGLMIATEHNLAFYKWLTRTAREKIQSGEYRQWKINMIERLNNTE